MCRPHPNPVFSNPYGGQRIGMYPTYTIEPQANGLRTGRRAELAPVSHPAPAIGYVFETASSVVLVCLVGGCNWRHKRWTGADLRGDPNQRCGVGLESKSPVLTSYN